MRGRPGAHSRAASSGGPVAVVGAGTMGRGIAHVAALAGRPVRLFDVDADAVSRALDRIRAALEKGIELGKVEPRARDAALARIVPAPSIAEGVSGADVVLEAVPEDPELKRTVLAAAGEAAPREALVATNTSSLAIGGLADALPRPGRFLGLHFFNPAHILPLVEVIRGDDTAGETVERGVAFVRELGKEPVVVRDSPGFASSRLGVTLGLEAMRMVEEGVAEPEAIDRVMELGYRHPMGPLELSDLVGLDVRLKIAEHLHRELGEERFRPPPILRRMVEEGRLGKKTGEGFYDWEEE